MIDAQGRERDGDWMQTNSGVAFWPLDPRNDEIILDDIAHALSQANRYGGHCKFPYSVAQHSVLIFDWLLAQEKIDKHTLAWAILHDAPEYVFGDFIRPVKHSIGGQYHARYVLLEDAIAHKFGLLTHMPLWVDECDKRIVLDEQAQLMEHPAPLEWSFYRDKTPLGVVIEEWDWRKAKAEFLGRCDAVGLK